MINIAKRGALVILFTILLSFSVSAAANFSAQAGYDWVASQSASDGSYDDDVYVTSIATLALGDAGYETSLSEDWLIQQVSNDGCLPTGGCETTATSAAVLAFDEVQETSLFDLIEGWYADTLEDADITGQWSLEVITDGSGTCSISYELNEEIKEVDIVVEAGVFPDCNNDNFLDLDKCVQSNLITTNPGITLDIDCNSITENVILSMVYQSDSTYYILANENSDTADFQVNNGCYGRSEGTSCNVDASLWAGYALQTLDSSIDTFVYLKETYDATDPVNAAFLYLITKEDKYVSDLVDLQKADGSFDRDVFSTGLAALALKDNPTYSAEFEDAQAFLREEQSEEGDWSQDIVASSMALYGAFSGESVSAGSCFDGLKNGAETGIDCGGACASCSSGSLLPECTTDSDCEALYTDDYICDLGNCILGTATGSICITDEDCDVGEVCLDDQCIASDCNYDGKCEYPDWDETSFNCPSDCSCGDNICDNSESSSSCPSDCEGDEPITPPVVSEPEPTGGSSVVAVIIILLLLIGLGVLGYFAYKKGWFKRKGKKPKQPKAGTPGQPSYKPFTGRLPAGQRRPLPGQATPYGGAQQPPKKKKGLFGRRK